MIKQLWSVMYLLMIEIIFGMYILFFPYSIQKKDIPILPYFLLMVLSSLLFASLLVKLNAKAKLVYLIIIFPLLLFAGKMVGFHLSASLLMGFLVFWRTLSHFNEHDKQNGGKWVLMTILTGIFLIFFAGLSSEKYMVQIALIMIGQILFIMFGGFIRRWLEVETDIKNKTQYFLPLITIFGGMGAGALLLAAGMKVYEKLFFFIINAGVSVIAFITSPFFNWAERQNWSEKMESLQEMQGPNEDTVKPSEMEVIGGNAGFDPAYIATAISLLCFIIIFIYIYKRKKIILHSRQEDPVGYSSEIFSFIGEGGFFHRNKITPPNNPIRKEIFAFEKFARKRNLGRQPFESLSDWLDRIGIMDYDEINSIYEKVRYGVMHYSNDEERIIKERLQLKKKELIELNKGQR